MGHTFCPECGKKYRLRDDIVGKKVKCKCGASFRAPSSASALATTPVVSRVCPHCQHEVQPHWKACPECGERLPAGTHQTSAGVQPPPRPVSTAIRTGSNSVVKAVVSQQLSPQVEPEAPHLITRPVPPMIRTGNESVVKAEINASHNVSAAGDIVTHKEVHSTHQETHIHHAESAATSIMQGIQRLFDPSRSAKTIDPNWANTPGGMLAIVVLSAIALIAAAVMITAISLSEAVRESSKRTTSADKPPSSATTSTAREGR